MTKSPKRIKAKKEDRKKRGKTSKRRVKKMKDEIYGEPPMPRKGGGQHPPESTQKSHECERNMVKAHASTRGERRAPRSLGSRGPLKRFS